ncbi:MAG: GHKL domain-containing protein [Culturomica sp.]|jgi:signal transduction histidine kinase|nr:GHKL domain-containing protein [Culturomica sp.]
MKKAWIVLIIDLFLLLGTLSWEYILVPQDRDSWVRRLENRLHRQETKADQLLRQLEDTANIRALGESKDLAALLAEDGKFTFWTDETLGVEGIYEKLRSDKHFQKINNAFYEVRKRIAGNRENYVLIRIKDDYPYENRYIRNHFGKFLRIKGENAQHIRVSPEPIASGVEISSKEGAPLFYIYADDDFRDRTLNIPLIVLYLLIFITLFYVFDITLSQASSLRAQLLSIVGFLLFLLLLRGAMIHFRIPASLYRLRLFDPEMPECLIASVGDLFLSAFSLTAICFIVFPNLRINTRSPLLYRFRYIALLLPPAALFFYLLFCVRIIRSLLLHTNTYLNMANVVAVEPVSVIAFVGIVAGVSVTLIAANNALQIVRPLFPLRTVWPLVVIELTLLTLLSHWSGVAPAGYCGLLLILLYSLLAVNQYVIRRDARRTIYMIGIGILSVFIVWVSKKYEREREIRQRLEYAGELIGERDENFEKHLQKIEAALSLSDTIGEFVEKHDEEALQIALTEEFLDTKGYNYSVEITVCGETDQYPAGQQSAAGCGSHFDRLLDSLGVPIAGTSFYALNEFDGRSSYLGKFRYGQKKLCLRFDSRPYSEGAGYPQILSRRSTNGNGTFYHYSYAKYRDGKLIYSSGNFNYYKLLTAFKEYDGTSRLIKKDQFQHLLIPVEKNAALIISLHEGIFSLYNFNVLYAFFICVLISSYGLFFSPNHNLGFKRGTLKARIKNNTIFLVVSLCAILTALFIYLNTKSFENRHRVRAMDSIKFVNRELEHLPCVEYLECPEILDILTGMSEILKVDINIYSDRGRLTATSRPEIFTSGFCGYLINGEALEQVIDRGAMTCVVREQIGELGYMSIYMPLVLDDGRTYIIHIPYFSQNDELNLDIAIMVVIAVNVSVMIMVLAFMLSGVVAERVTKPLQLVNDKLKSMHIGGKNERIAYNLKDEVGELIGAYNKMADKLEESVEQLAKSERESAWREMARQIAHEIKNPLTPMKLNIQFMQRSLQIEDPKTFKKRFEDISIALTEQIDNMASIASAFSDFAKISVTQKERVDLSELVKNSILLFENSVRIACDITPGIEVWGDRIQLSRVMVNILKNAVQSVPEEREARIRVSVHREDDQAVIRVRDNGTGIPEEVREKIFNPKFTTKSSGMGLGLAISRRIVEHIGGNITFVCPEEGTEFTVRLPLAQEVTTCPAIENTEK